MWQLLLNFIGGPIIKGLLDAYKAKIDLRSKQDVLAVDLASKEIEGEIKARQIEASIIRQEEGRWWTACIRPLFALPFIIFTFKVIVWDKVLGSWTHGHTDAIDPNMWSVFITVIGAYFGGRTIEKVARIFNRK